MATAESDKAVQDKAGKAKPDRAREAARAGACLFAFLVLAFAGHFIEGRGLFFDAIWDPVSIHSFFTGDELAIKTFQEGLLPVWDPTRGLGAPHVLIFGNADHPLKILAYLLPSAVRWDVYIFVRLWLAGLFTFMLAREIPVGFRGSLLAGASFMLCGYFREFLNMPDINVNMITPLVMLFLFRAVKGSGFCWLLAVLAGTLCDTNPESMVYAVGYFGGFTILAGALSRRERPIGGFVQGAAVLLLGIWFAYFLDADGIGPFAEFFRRSWTFHLDQIGLLHVSLSASIGLATPAFDYWIFNPPKLDLDHLEQLTIVPAYIGIATFTLASLALLRFRELPRHGLYFAGAVPVLFGVVFGLPPFNLIARLPLLNLFQHFRYLQPFLTHALCLLAGMGLELLLRDPRRRRDAAIIAGLVLAWTAGHIYIFRHQIMASEYVMTALFAFIAGAGVLAAAAHFISRRRPAALGAAIIAACILELCLYFNLARSVFGPGDLKPKPRPAAQFIKARSNGPSRIIGLEGNTLHPNQAGLSGLSDLRDQSAMYPREYANLMAQLNGYKTEREKMHGFLNGGKFFFMPSLERISPEVLDSLNLRFILSRETIGAAPLAGEKTTVDVLIPDKGRVAPAQIQAGGRTRQAVIAHAPSRIEVTPGAGKTGTVLTGAAIMDKALECGESADGAMMAVVRKTQGGPSLVFAKSVPARRGSPWVPIETPLSPQDKSLVFITLPGARDVASCDYAAWIEPELQTLDTAQRLGLNLIYDREVRVYENPGAAKRVYGVRRVNPAADAKQAMERTFSGDPLAEVWAESAAGTSADPLAVSEIGEVPGRLEFAASCPGRCFAVISNLAYPGWRAFLDGREERIYRVGGVFQGVFLPLGDSRVKLVYHPPVYRVFLWFRWTAVFCALAAMFGIWLKSRGHGRRE